MSQTIPLKNATLASKPPVAIWWLRRDFRLHDNAALSKALASGLKVVPIFIFDEDILSKLQDRDDARVSFIHNELLSLNEEFKALGSSLWVAQGTPLKVWKRILNEFNVQGVYSNEDYEPYAMKRDSDVGALLKANGTEYFRFKDHVIFEKSEIEKQTGGPYTVFTPYSKKWKSQLTKGHLQPFESQRENFFKFNAGKIPSLKELGFKESSIVFPTRKVDLQIIADYADTRNFPAIRGTSRLGLHLRFGTVSIRELVSIAQTKNETWLNELIWREFFTQVLWNYPHVTKVAFRSDYDKIKYRQDEKEFSLWCEGRTGFPIVDAGMRELNSTGFMHNRVRMVAASFLVKHLLIDWRWGEEYFARKLLDFELASNNGNWQWVAGSGCDAAPYFRVFNPETQAKKFDPKSEYIKKWIPEFGTSNYPDPMIDHVEARTRFLRSYEVALGRKSPEPTRVN